MDCIVFRTKNAEAFLPYLLGIDEMGYRYSFQFTVTPYGADIEKNVGDKPTDYSKVLYFIASNRKRARRLAVRSDSIIKEHFSRVAYRTISKLVQRIEGLYGYVRDQFFRRI